HRIINHLGEILALKITAGNTDDRKVVRELAKELIGSLYGDKGYLSQEVADDLAKNGVTFITKKRSNMKASVLEYWDKIM
ncbi:Transposase DDE domain-containing protein, partial [Xenorhabdus japonica]